MGILLDVGYLLTGVLLSPWLLFKGATDKRYRHRLSERFGWITPSEKKTLWVHCASVGEVNLAKPIVARLKKSHPDLSFHVTTVTLAGRENAEKAFPDARVSYFPLDFGGSVRRAIRRIRPVGVVLV